MKPERGIGVVRHLRARLFSRDARGVFLSSLVFWNPLLAGALTFVLGGSDHFFPNWLLSSEISEVVALQCFAASYLFRWTEARIYGNRGWEVPKHGLGLYLVIAGIVMPFALSAAFRLAGATARLLGYRWGAPDFGSYRIGIGFGLVLMLTFFFFVARRDADDARRAVEVRTDARIKDLEAARLKAQLAALSAEMNPHLLFNALNTVASLVHEDPDRAEEVVLELSDLYRGVLRASGAATHPLGDEIALCEAYLRIEQARFGDRLLVKVDVDPSIDPRAIDVPVLVIQPFVENAVKHGISPRARGGRVSLTVRRDGANVAVSIVDDGVGLGNSTHRGAGRAMANCKDRLRLTYGDRARLEVTGGAGGGSGGVEIVVSMPERVPTADGRS